MRYFDSFFFAVTLAVLNTLDAFLTLLLGSGEINPFLEPILALGPGPFLFFKLVVVNAVIYLCYHRGAFTRFPRLSLGLVCLYLAVVAFSAGLLC
ncbi:MAG: DUF5658 family protein [Actinomycetota bacterium]|nr:DUF5658 family protein [Actinomycetota bacterium]